MTMFKDAAIESSVHSVYDPFSAAETARIVRDELGQSPELALPPAYQPNSAIDKYANPADLMDLVPKAASAVHLAAETAVRRSVQPQAVAVDARNVVNHYVGEPSTYGLSVTIAHRDLGTTTAGPQVLRTEYVVNDANRHFSEEVVAALGADAMQRPTVHNYNYPGKFLG